MRALGIDLGSERIGIALSDSGGVLATPYEVVLRSGRLEVDHERILQMAQDVGAECIVVGLPLSLNGSCGPAAESAIAEADALAERTDIAVVTHDERLTTVSAERSLKAMNMKAPARRSVVDKVAAAVMLQAWLDNGCGAPPDFVDSNSAQPTEIA